MPKKKKSWLNDYVSVWEEIKERLDIVEIIGEYVNVKQVGNNYKCVCPFHNDHNPSLVISREKNIWHCFGCGAGGDVFKFVMDYENIDKKNTLKKLAKKANIELKELPKKKEQSSTSTISNYELGLKYLEWTARIYHGLLKKILLDRNNPITQYCLQRNLSQKAIDEFEIGYAPKGNFLLELAKKHDLDLEIMTEVGVLKKTNESFKDKFVDRLIVPIQNPKSQVVGFTARILPYEKTERPKYLNSAASIWFNKSKLWYGWKQNNSQIRKDKKAMVVEGNMDVITSWSLGHDYAVASQGTSFTREQLSLLKKLTSVIWLAFDNDTAGLIAGRKLFIEASRLGFEVKKVLIPEDYKDLDEYLQAKKVDVLESLPYLDYYLKKYSRDLTSKNLEIQRPAIVDFVELLASTDQLTKEHYLNQLSEITKKSYRALNLQLQKIVKTSYINPESVKAVDIAPDVSIQDSVFVAWEELLSLRYAANSKNVLSISEKKLAKYYAILSQLLDKLTSEISFESYLNKNEQIFKLISSQLSESEIQEQQLLQKINLYINNNYPRISIDPNLQKLYLELFSSD